jgi:hypothetical protein
MGPIGPVLPEAPEAPEAQEARRAQEAPGGLLGRSLRRDLRDQPDRRLQDHPYRPLDPRDLEALPAP